MVFAVAVQHVVLDRRERRRRAAAPRAPPGSARAAGRARSARRPSAPRRHPRAGSRTRSSSRRRCPAGAGPGPCSRIRAKIAVRIGAKVGAVEVVLALGRLPSPEHFRLARCRCSSSRWSTTGPASAAGRGSLASGRSKAPFETRSTRSSPRGTGWPSPDAPTRACTRRGRSRASTSPAGRLRSGRARRSTRRCRRTSPCWPSSPRRQGSTRASRPGRAPTVTGSCRRGVRSPFAARRALWWPRPLDRDALEAAAALIPGRHDFTAFTPTETQHRLFTRTVLERRLGGARRRAPLHDRRRELPPAHGADARRDDARGARAWGRCWRGGRAARPG